MISDIVSDEDVPERLKQDLDLWSGCISGSFREDLFLEAFEQAGFYGVSLLERQQDPWRTVEGIEFRSVTVVAYKGKEKHLVVRPSEIMGESTFWSCSSLRSALGGVS